MEPEAAEPSFELQSGLSFQLGDRVFERPPVQPLYRFSLLVVALAMILLPLLYLALIGCFGYAVYWYAVHFSHFLHNDYIGRGGWLLIELGYFVPLFAGSVMFLFMIKPLFAPRQKENEHFSLELADAPQLFTFLGWICRSLNAPIPSRVDVDCSINASAGFRSGFSSFFGNDIVLTIGLPLVAGMNVSQLAGVIAHEYGHFSQGVGMRANYLIWRINRWLFRVVYERDAWDLWLVETSEDSDDSPRSALVFYFVRLAVWLGRGPAWVLFVLGHFLSSFMSRQMEFDADRYQMKMSGSECFIATSLRLQQLNLGSEIAEKQSRAKWKKEKKLFDQIPDFIVSRANEISADTQSRHFAEAYKRKTHYFDSHPSDAERVARAQAAHEPGVLDVSEPARTLFANFPELARRASEFFYRGVLGPTFTPQWLESTEQVVARADYDYAPDRQRISAYFLGATSNLRPIILPESMPLVYRSQETLMAELRACRDQVLQASPGACAAIAAFHGADARHLQLQQAATLIQSGFAIDPARFNLPDGDLEPAMAQAAQSLLASDAALKPFEQIVRTRLTTAIQLLRLATFAKTLPEAPQFQQHIKDMIFAQVRLANCFHELLETRVECFALDAVLQHRREQGAGDNLTQALEALSTKLREHAKSIQKQTGQIRYPFGHAIENAFVSDFARNKEYYADPSEAALREGACHVEKLLALHERILANIIEVCEKVELHAAV